MEIVEVTIDNLKQVAALEVHEDQKHFIASNLMTVAQAKFYPDVILPALVDQSTENQPIYMGMIAYFPSGSFIEKSYEHIAMIMRFMIDRNFQGQGYGIKMMQMIVEEIQQNYPEVNAISLTVVPENIGAKTFYEKYGFQATGKQHFDEDEYQLTLNG